MSKFFENFDMNYYSCRIIKIIQVMPGDAGTKAYRHFRNSWSGSGRFHMCGRSGTLRPVPTIALALHLEGAIALPLCAILDQSWEAG
jgi:hypothetical protein